MHARRHAVDADGNTSGPCDTRGMVNSALTVRQARAIRRKAAKTQAEARFTRARARLARATALIWRYIETKTGQPPRV